MKFIKAILDAVIHARKLQAADQIARNLIATNKDFKHLSHSELVHFIMDEENPRHLDGTLIKKNV